jgi:hypothetical protein
MMTEKRMAEAVRERGDAKWAETMAQLHETHFANLVVDAGAVRNLKIIARLLSNPHSALQASYLRWGRM